MKSEPSSGGVGLCGGDKVVDAGGAKEVSTALSMVPFSRNYSDFRVDRGVNNAFKEAIVDY